MHVMWGEHPKHLTLSILDEHLPISRSIDLSLLSMYIHIHENVSNDIEAIYVACTYYVSIRQKNTFVSSYYRKSILPIYFTWSVILNYQGFELTHRARLIYTKLPVNAWYLSSLKPWVRGLQNILCMCVYYIIICHV